MMVIDFQQKIQTGSYPSVTFDDDTMNLDNLRVLCIDKLRQTQQTYREHCKIEAFTDVQEREEATREHSCRSIRRQRLDRLNTRKHGVSGIAIPYFVPHVHACRPSKDAEKLSNKIATATLKNGT